MLLGDLLKRSLSAAPVIVQRIITLSSMAMVSSWMIWRSGIASMKEDAIYFTLSGLRCNAGGMMGFLQTKSETRISSATSNFGSWIKLLTIFGIKIKRRINMWVTGSRLAHTCTQSDRFFRLLGDFSFKNSLIVIIYFDSPSLS